LNKKTAFIATQQLPKKTVKKEASNFTNAVLVENNLSVVIGLIQSKFGMNT
jgi:hypothetical protein